MSPPSFESSRAEIEQIDRTIAEQIGRRLEVSRAIAAAKASRGRPLRDYSVEAAVLARWSRALGQVGVSPARAEALARWLIEESLRVQEAASPPVRAVERRPDGSYDVAIVGGSGAMGQWLAGFLGETGHQVAVVDTRAPPGGEPTLPDVESAARHADVVVFATPIRDTAPLLRRAVETATDALLCDVLSVKAPIVPVLEQAVRLGRNVTSLHPMFGPSARTLSGRNLLIVSCGVASADRQVRALFQGSALTISEVPLPQHDRLIAESLGLSHAVNLLFLAALASDPLSPHEIGQAASTTFQRQSSLARAVASEGPELYLDIQALNPNSWSLYQELREAMDRLQGIVERRDGEAFRALLAEGRAKLEPGSEPMRA